MTSTTGNPSLTREGIEADVLRLLRETITEEWDDAFAAAPGPETRLVGDLGCDSQDLVVLGVAIEEFYGRRQLPFYRLFMTEAGRRADDLQIGALADFLFEELNGDGDGAAADG